MYLFKCHLFDLFLVSLRYFHVSEPMFVDFYAEGLGNEISVKWMPLNSSIRYTVYWCTGSTSYLCNLKVGLRCFYIFGIIRTFRLFTYLFIRIAEFSLRIILFAHFKDSYLGFSLLFI